MSVRVSFQWRAVSWGNHLACFILEYLLFLPACTELLLQLLDGNLQQHGCLESESLGVAKSARRH